MVNLRRRSTVHCVRGGESVYVDDVCSEKGELREATVRFAALGCSRGRPLLKIEAWGCHASVAPSDWWRMENAGCMALED